MFRAALPPVRRDVTWRRLPITAARRHLASAFQSEHYYVYRSGTEALAVALRDIRARNHFSRPEVIVPAYGCPDLVAAADFAGYSVKLVDNCFGCWGYDEDALHQAVSSSTCAVISVSLLGIADRTALIRRHVPRDRIVVDNAQLFDPASGGASAYTIFSFGRGKPLNLLGGGALVAETPIEENDCSEQCNQLFDSLIASRASAFLFNMTTRPVIFGPLSKIAPLRLGTTKYNALKSLRLRSPQFLCRLSPAVADYLRAPGYNIERWNSVLVPWKSFGIEPLRAADESTVLSKERIRLALLAPNRLLRDRLVQALNASGLGATKMYQRPLPEIAGVPLSVSRQAGFANASDLADRLFTLPSHSYVQANHIAEADHIVRRIMREGTY